MPSTPVTNADFTPAACVDRLNQLLSHPPLKVSMEGGGVEGEPQSLSSDYFVLIHRDEIRMIIRHLNQPKTD